MKKQEFYLLCAIVIGWLLPANCYGFDKGAHDALSRRAVDPDITNAAQLDSYLKSTLHFAFREGINEPLVGGKTVVRLIAEGSIQEDSPATRVLHHFHDPTRTWDQAGERFPPGIPLGNSSVIWSQMSPQGACCGNYAWKDARDAFYKALTSTEVSQRKSWYANTFEILGHLIHHVQDAAVPSHTRNDNHLQPFEFTKLPDGDPFHHWADTKAGSDQINGVTQALRFDRSILNQTSPNPLAQVPIARIIDKTDGDFGVLSPNLNIGLAEYSNANFISKGTGNLASSGYQYPSISQLTFQNETGPGPFGFKRWYARFRPGFGQQDYRVGVSSRMYGFVKDTVPLEKFPLSLDDKVHEDYGKKLFPRAIGYSAGLIDYFFRGKIDSTELSPTYNWVEWGTQSSSIRVENVSVKVDGTNEQGGQGTMRLVLLFRGTDSGETFPPVIVSEPVSVSAGSPQTVVFPFSSLPFPATHPPVYGTYSALYWGVLVYKGNLGQESEAVVADSSCINPNNGSRYSRLYIFEHAIGITLGSGLWQESAYFEGC